MREVVLCVDLGGSAAKVSTVGADGQVRTDVVELPLDRQGHRVEADLAAWWGLLADRPSVLRDDEQVRAVVVASLRQGYVLTDGMSEIAPAVLNSDRRGAPALRRLREIDDLYELTGHWAAPELTLPKLLVTAERRPELWRRTERVLFLHDWLVWRLTGVEVTEVSYACAGQLADVDARTWAKDLLERLGLGTGWCAPLVEAGTVVGATRQPFLGAPAGTPVVAGCGDTQLAAMAAGGLGDGVVTVVAGSSTPVQAATAAPVRDPLRHPWLSTHARPDRWAAETNCGYPGTMQGWGAGLMGAAPSGEPGARGVVAVTGAPAWTEEGWAVKAPMSLVGLRPDTTAADVAQALLEAHLATIRANVEDLERALGRDAAEVVLAGGAAERDPRFATELSRMLGRPIRVARSDAAAAAWQLATGEQLPVRAELVEPSGTGAYESSYARYLEVWGALRAALPEQDEEAQA
ncbi:MAG: FGGY family carbohydrate kinase [Motilibacteraceae bacterium]